MLPFTRSLSTRMLNHGYWEQTWQKSKGFTGNVRLRNPRLAADAIFKLTLQLEKFRLNLSSLDSRNWRMRRRDSVPSSNTFIVEGFDI